MKRIMIILGLAVVLFSALAAAHKSQEAHIYDINQGREFAMSEALPALKQNRILLVGEHHNNQRHHQAQINVVRLLKESGVQVAIGLEMFRSDSQDALDKWVAGKISEADFEAIFYENWGYSWENYRVIFEYARERKIPLIGLNVPREITRQVATRGFQSLNKEQKGKLSNISCRVDKEYMDSAKSG